jgi:hypothetical protein
MNCAQFEPQIIDLAAGRGETCTRLRSHLLSCKSCSARLFSERQLTHVLHELKANVRAIAIPASIEASLLAQFSARSHPSVLPNDPAPRKFRKIAQWASSVAIAATVVVCLTMVVSQSLRMPPTVSPIGVAESKRTLSAPPKLETTTPFYRIYAGGARIAGANGLVRVQVPRATLAVFGLPFDPRRANAPIMADLLVDNVGMVTAMRFVQ